MRKAVILCSGGLDSVVMANYIRNKLIYNKLIILFFDYNQNSLNSERRSSKKTAKEIKADFLEIKINLIDNSNLTNKKKINKINIKDLKNSYNESRKFYVSNRNGIFLSYAISLADKLKGADIFVGFNSEGNEAYPDANIKFIKEMNNLMKLLDIKGHIKSPFINKDKDEIVKLGKKLNVNINETFSCYVSNKHCGVCLACRLRQEAFYWANIKDNTKYKNKMKDYRNKT
ncbi:MAG: 7-cyano-7-deazaguanine synthase [Nanoarchaeota archaeon]